MDDGYWGELHNFYSGGTSYSVCTGYRLQDVQYPDNGIIEIINLNINNRFATRDAVDHSGKFLDFGFAENDNTETIGQVD